MYKQKSHMQCTYEQSNLVKIMTSYMQSEQLSNEKLLPQQSNEEMDNDAFMSNSTTIAIDQIYIENHNGQLALTANKAQFEVSQRRKNERSPEEPDIITHLEIESLASRRSEEMKTGNSHQHPKHRPTSQLDQHTTPGTYTRQPRPSPRQRQRKPQYRWVV